MMMSFIRVSPVLCVVRIAYFVYAWLIGPQTTLLRQQICVVRENYRTRMTQIERIFADFFMSYAVGEKEQNFQNDRTKNSLILPILL